MTLKSEILKEKYNWFDYIKILKYLSITKPNQQKYKHKKLTKPTKQQQKQHRKLTPSNDKLEHIISNLYGQVLIDQLIKKEFNGGLVK